jgi:hypothetical protein
MIEGARLVDLILKNMLQEDEDMMKMPRTGRPSLELRIVELEKMVLGNGR